MFFKKGNRKNSPLLPVSITQFAVSNSHSSENVLVSLPFEPHTGIRRMARIQLALQLMKGPAMTHETRANNRKFLKFILRSKKSHYFDSNELNYAGKNRLTEL